MEMKMLSRVGKSTDEKYSVLKKKKEILSGERKKFIVKSTFLKPKKDPDANFLERIRLIQNKKLPEPKQLLLANKKLLSKNNTTKRSRKHRNSVEIIKGRQSSFRAISRGTYYKVNSVRDLPPPCGYYNINYDLVDKNVPTKKLELYQERKNAFLIKKDNLDIDYPDIKVFSHKIILIFRDKINRRDILISKRSVPEVHSKRSK